MHMIARPRPPFARFSRYFVALALLVAALLGGCDLGDDPTGTPDADTGGPDVADAGDTSGPPADTAPDGDTDETPDTDPTDAGSDVGDADATDTDANSYAEPTPLGRALIDLQEASEIPPRVRFERGLPRFLELRVKLPGSPEDDMVTRVLTFLEQHRDLFQIDDVDRDLYLDRARAIDAPLGEGADPLKAKQIVFSQRVGDLTVEYSRLSLLIVGEHLVMASGRYLPAVQAARLKERPHAPGISQNEARGHAVEDSGLRSPRVTGEASLVLFDRRLAIPEREFEDETTRLAWRFAIESTDRSTGEPEAWQVFVDAENGDILWMENETPSHGSSEDMSVYDLDTNPFDSDDGCSRSDQTEWFTEAGPTSNYPGTFPGGDADGDTAYQSARDLYTEMFDRYHRHGYDGADGKADFFVHVGRSDGTAWNNAQYNGFCDHFRFGDGLTSEDIIIHEISHGIDAKEGGLVYANQSGAIDESMADLLSGLVTDDWRMGEDSSLGVIRDLRDPPANGDPDHMQSARSGDGRGLRPAVTTPTRANDFGAVHTNSGISNKAAYLISEGGRHQGLAIEGIGNEKASWIFYLTLTSMESNDTFQDLRDKAVSAVNLAAWLSSSSGAGPFDDSDVCQVINAYASVGIGDPDTDCDGSPDNRSDGDGDGFPDGADNCPNVPNPAQGDRDGDGDGDVCDGDADGDGLQNARDNCPDHANPSQRDADGDGTGNVCEDDDGDGHVNPEDNCPNDANADQADADDDGTGDVCDTDRDGDSHANTADNCPDLANRGQDDSDGDGVGNACDNCLEDANAGQGDNDHDGRGDACDPDDDDDGILDVEDNCRTVANADQLDTDRNGTGLLCDSKEFDKLDGLKKQAHIAVLWAHKDGMRVPITPCQGGLCPDWMPFDARMQIAVATSPLYSARVLDERGHVVSRTTFIGRDPNGGGARTVVAFRPDEEFAYRSPRLDEGARFGGRKYFLELYGGPNQPDGTKTSGEIRFQTELPK